jgi:hypothetical protein
MDKILIRSSPKITPTKISVPDMDNVKGANEGRAYSVDENVEGHASRRGSMTPIVQIGGLRIPEKMVKSLSVWQNDLLPEISISIIDVDGVFGAGLYPVADILISIFIRSQNEQLKSLSADYLITSISSVVIPHSNMTVYTMAGELHVPKINGMYSKAYKNMTSLEALKKVADDLQLGFADNQPENTNDKMTWLMPNYTYKSFINHIKKIAYRDDNNFFDCFIDRYYILNFINVEKMFSQDPELDTGLLALEQTALDRRRKSEKDEPDESTDSIEIVLSNHTGIKGSEFYIADYSLMSHHGEVLANNALRKHAYWYDHGGNDDPETLDTVNFIDHYVEPLQTAVSNDGLSPQTVNIPDFKDDKPDRSVSGAWTGIDYSNAHRSYKFAGVLNHQNLLETKKNEMRIVLNGININVLRGSRVPVLIYLNRTASHRANSARVEPEELGGVEDVLDQGILDSTDGPAQQILDRALSGFYYVSSIKYSYHDEKFFTEMLLSRRHWKLPRPKNKVRV